MNCHTLSPNYDGTSRTMLAHIASSIFYIPPLYADCFTKRQLLYWQGRHILSQMKAGQIIRGDTAYNVIFTRCCTRGSLISAPMSQYALSFREPCAKYDIPAYVLISGV